MAAGANDVDDEVEGKRDDDDEKPAEVGADVAAVGVAPKEIGAVVLVPNGAAVDGPAPNVNEELVVFGAEATVVAGVEPNPNAEGCVDELAFVAPKENVDGWVDASGALIDPNVNEGGCVAGAAFVDPNVNEDGCVTGAAAGVDPNAKVEGWVVEVAGVDPNVNEDGWLPGAVDVEPREKEAAVVPVVGANPAPNPNAPVLPPNCALVGALVVLAEPNVNGVAVAAVVGAVVVKPPPNENGVALAVVVVEGAPNGNIFFLWNIQVEFKWKKKKWDYDCETSHYSCLW